MDWVTMAIMVVPLGIMYFALIVPQRKKDKALNDMRSDIAIGDRVVTVGGIIGRVVNIGEDAITIETGNEKTRLRMLRTSIQQKESVEQKQSRGG